MRREGFLLVWAAAALAMSISGRPIVVWQALPESWPMQCCGRQWAMPRAVLAARSSGALPRYSR